MAISIQKKQAQPDSGPGLGTLLGALGGVAATVATGGAAAPITAGALLSGASTGAGLGGVGESILSSGSKTSQAGELPTSDGSMQRRLAQSQSESNIKALRDAAISLPHVDQTTRDQAMQPILSAYQQESQKMRG